ncbi:MAG: hypothetical protein FJ190_13150 [Gammaproteobacteria bacterium]|nr:hypothetical protein [Gammaproteobacteria bacterium]
MPTKSARLQHIQYPVVSERQEQGKFPNSLYFQIHFEYLESQLSAIRRNMEDTQTQIADLSAQVALLTKTLIELNNLE